MRQVLRFGRCFAAAVVVVGLLVCGGASATADQTPTGPRIAVVVSGSATAAPEMLTIGPNGEEPRTLVGTSAGLEDIGRPIWNADGEELAFVGHGGLDGLGIYLSGPDGLGLHRLETSSELAPSQVLLPEPVFDPATGALLVEIMKEGSGSAGSALFSFPVDGSRPHRLSPWTGTRFVHPSSVAPDGRLVAAAEGIKGFYVGLIRQNGSGARTLVPQRWFKTKGARGTRQGADPAVSPDGTQVAYLVERFKKGAGVEAKSIGTDLMLIPIGGGAARKIATVKGEARWPTWDPSGSRLAFTVGDYRHHELMEVNADGTCLRMIYKARGSGAVWGAAWQPGEGRGAGPISC